MIDSQSKSALDAVAAPEGYPSPWDEAPKNIPNLQANEEDAMTGNGETTTNAQPKGATIAAPETSVQCPPKKKRNTMKDVAGKINQLRELARQGRSREEICEMLGITRQGFETLRRKLSDIDKVYYDIPYETAGRGSKVGKGGIMVSADKLEAMGAAKIFSEGKPISVRFVEGCILIQCVGAKNTLTLTHSVSPAEISGDRSAGEAHAQSKSEVEVA